MSLNYRGATALVTGASAGLGAEFARQFAARGTNLVLVARREDRLAELAAELTARHQVTVTVNATDLGRPGIGAALLSDLTARDIVVDFVVNNAGFGLHGNFATTDPERIAAAIQLNVAALVDISRAFLPGQLERGQGAIVNIASTAGYQPTPYMAVYGATKAFVLAFTEAVAVETRKTDVRVLAVSPGATETEFFTVVGSDKAKVGNAQTAEQVVTTALRALDGRRRVEGVISGTVNRITSIAGKLMPRRVTLAISGYMLSH